MPDHATADRNLLLLAAACDDVADLALYGHVFSDGALFRTVAMCHGAATVTVLQPSCVIGHAMANASRKIYPQEELFYRDTGSLIGDCSPSIYSDMSYEEMKRATEASRARRVELDRILTEATNKNDSFIEDFGISSGPDFVNLMRETAQKVREVLEES